MTDSIAATCRCRLARIQEDSEQLIAELDRFRRVYSQMAPLFAPDQFPVVYALRQWTKDAIAALDAGEQIPPPPLGDES